MGNDLSQCLYGLAGPPKPPDDPPPEPMGDPEPDTIGDPDPDDDDPDPIGDPTREMRPRRAARRWRR
jgi:hypothetical protein